MIDVYFGDNLAVTSKLPSESFELVYIDPPFNTGKAQSRTQNESPRFSTEVSDAV